MSESESWVDSLIGVKDSSVQKTLLDNYECSDQDKWLRSLNDAH